MRKSSHTRAYRVLVETLVAARKGAGLTQAALAERLGRPQSFVAKYEGSQRRIDLVELFEIAAVLEIDPRRIFQTVAKAL